MTFRGAVLVGLALPLAAACGGRQIDLEGEDARDAGATGAGGGEGGVTPVGCAKSGFRCDGDTLVQCGSGRDQPITRCMPGLCDAAQGRCDAAPPGCKSDAECTSKEGCTQGACAAGTCTSRPSPPGTPCPGGTCDGAGACAGGPGCKSDVECAGGNPCIAGFCSGGACSAKPYPAGVACPNGTCDGNGSCTGGGGCSPGQCGACASGDACAQCCVDEDPSAYEAFLLRVAARCVCKPGAACEKQCAGPDGSMSQVCQMPDPNLLFVDPGCVDCINASSGACLNDAANDCTADGSCVSFVKCAGLCPAG
jgi:hypothetical protein